MHRQSLQGMFVNRVTVHFVLRARVSTTPNPYAEIPSIGRNPPVQSLANKTPQPPTVKLRNGGGPIIPSSRRDTDLSTTSSTITCSTCPTDSSFTERESTITEESWDEGSGGSARSSAASEDTVIGRPLLAPPRSGSQQPLPKPFADYFKGSGRPSTATPQAMPATTR